MKRIIECFGRNQAGTFCRRKNMQQVHKCCNLWGENEAAASKSGAKGAISMNWIQKREK
jgi:hypothetical protein